MIGSQESKESLIRSGGNMNDLTSLRQKIMHTLGYCAWSEPSEVCKHRTDALNENDIKELDELEAIVAQEVLRAIDTFEWKMDCTTGLSELYGWKGWVATAKEQTINFLELSDQALTRTPPLSGKEQV